MWKDEIKKEAANFKRGRKAAKRLWKKHDHPAWFQVENDDEFMAELQKRFDERTGGTNINVRELIRSYILLIGAFRSLTKEN